MDDMRELYQTTILDHNKRPRNFGALEEANRRAEGHNPLCGDQLVVTLLIDDDDCVADVRFDGSGCAISTASASLMTEAVKGKNIEDVDRLFERFHEMVTSRPDANVDTGDLGKLAVFSGVREFPMRVKCASLAWHTLQAAVRNKSEIARTE